MFEFELPKNGFKNEKTFTTWFGRQIKNLGGFRHKISDADPGYKPADAIVALNGKTFLIEFKIGDEKRKVNLTKKLRPNQYVGLLRWQMNGGDSLIVYYNRFYNKYRIEKFNEEGNILEIK